MYEQSKAFCEHLGRMFPDLALVLKEHKADNDEILPHLFMADVTRYILSDGPNRKPLVSYLDKSLRGEREETQNVIAVSFVEHLESDQELERALRGVTAEALREEWRRQQST